jgi:hypothetical protein
MRFDFQHARFKDRKQTSWTRANNDKVGIVNSHTFLILLQRKEVGKVSFTLEKHKRPNRSLLLKARKNILFCDRKISETIQPSEASPPLTFVAKPCTILIKTKNVKYCKSWFSKNRR